MAPNNVQMATNNVQKCNFSLSWTLYFQTFLGEHALEPIRRPEKIFLAAAWLQQFFRIDSPPRAPPLPNKNPDHGDLMRPYRVITPQSSKKYWHKSCFSWTLHCNNSLAHSGIKMSIILPHLTCWRGEKILCIISHPSIRSFCPTALTYQILLFCLFRKDCFDLISTGFRYIWNFSHFRPSCAC